MIAYKLKHKKTKQKKKDFRSVPFTEVAFFADDKRSGQITQTYDHSPKSHGNFYTSPCLFIYFV